MFWQELADSLRRSHPGALLVTGANTLRYYAAGVQPRTARRDGFGEGYYDVFNTAICYEGLYGDFYGDFVRRGAQFMAIISNDGWWGDTPGYKHLFTISRLRAVEHRRAIARSANTGMSGFISARGDIGQTLGWEKRGVLTAPTPALRDSSTRAGTCSKSWAGTVAASSPERSNSTAN